MTRLFWLMGWMEDSIRRLASNTWASSTVSLQLTLARASLRRTSDSSWRTVIR